MASSAFARLEKPLKNKQLDKVIDDYMCYYREPPSNNSSIYPGVITVLNKIRDLEIQMGVFSNKSFDMVNLILESFGLNHYFSGATGGDSVAFNKPDPRHIAETLKLLNIRGEKCVNGRLYS